MDRWESPHGRRLPKPGERTLIMGVLNVTPDSFSDGGQLPTTNAVVARARDLVAAGADLLDLGGESTRPGGAPVTADEELHRLLPALAALRRELPDVPISIDTYKASVADEAIDQGADVINDVWGGLHGVSSATRETWRQQVRDTGRLTPDAATPMARVAARRRCPLILMHNRPDRTYADFWADLLLDLQTCVANSRAAGVEPNQLWLDPGFGFAKNIAQNLEVLRELRRIVALGFPVLVGTSRKSTLGAVLGTTVDDRIEAGGATVVWAIQQGTGMVRVHDVAEMARFARMADAIKAGLGYAAG